MHLQLPTAGYESLQLAHGGNRVHICPLNSWLPLEFSALSGWRLGSQTLAHMCAHSWRAPLLSFPAKIPA